MTFVNQKTRYFVNESKFTGDLSKWRDRTNTSSLLSSIGFSFVKKKYLKQNKIVKNRQSLNTGDLNQTQLTRLKTKFVLNFGSIGSELLNGILHCLLFFKHENFQRPIYFLTCHRKYYYRQTKKCYSTNEYLFFSNCQSLLHYNALFYLQNEMRVFF